MPITEMQRLARRASIGSSDMAAILGFCPWKTAYDVWLDKTGRIEDATPSDAMELGTEMESVVLAFAERDLGAIKENVHVEKPEFHLASNVDAVVVATNEPVEAKTSGITGRLFGNWGTAGTDEVPDNVIIQSHVHMICLEDEADTPPHCWVPAILGGRGYNLFKVPYCEDIAETIKTEAVKFWTCVEKDEAPVNAEPSLDVLERIRREPNSWQEVEPSVVANWLKAKEAEKNAKDEAKQAKKLLVHALGECEGAKLIDEGKAITYLQQSRTQIDSKALRRDHPDIAAKYEQVSTFRVLREKKLDTEAKAA